MEGNRTKINKENARKRYIQREIHSTTYNQFGMRLVPKRVGGTGHGQLCVTRVGKVQPSLNDLFQLP